MNEWENAADKIQMITGNMDTNSIKMIGITYLCFTIQAMAQLAVLINLKSGILTPGLVKHFGDTYFPEIFITWLVILMFLTLFHIIGQVLSLMLFRREPFLAFFPVQLLAAFLALMFSTNSIFNNYPNEAHQVLYVFLILFLVYAPVSSLYWYLSRRKTYGFPVSVLEKVLLAVAVVVFIFIFFYPDGNFQLGI